jgi:TolB protein
MIKTLYAAVLLAAASLPAPAEDAHWKLGLFEAAANVGENPRAGSTEFDAARSVYRITGGGANIWNRVDAFQYVWRRLSGDAALSADVEFLGTSAANHRKAVLMFRQSLDADAAYADIAVHGDGMIALQSRLAKGEITTHIVSPAKGRRVRIERHGDQFTMYVGRESSGPVTVALREPVYLGIGVSAHDAAQLETAVFSSVSIEPLGTQSQRPAARSKISVYDLASKSVRVVYTAEKVFEAPNWTPDGKFLLTNSGGKLYRLPASGGQPEVIDLGEVDNINNDHGVSPDGKHLVVSARLNGMPPKLYISGSDGRNRRQLTAEGPSYFHGWSPDGKWMVFTGQRNANFDLYRTSESGEQSRLTAHPAYDDGPDYSPDGKWIYFNSERSGSGDIWRIPSEGAGDDDIKAQQVTADEMEDWFAHPSPDGKWLLFLSYPKGTKGHPPNLNVELRMMPLPGDQLQPARIVKVVSLFGGQGTINVNSWSPDSKRFAFVSYELPTR